MNHRRTAAVLVCLTLAGCGGSSGGDVVIGDGGIVEWDAGAGPRLPAVAGTTLEGTPLDLAAWKGQVIVLNMWGTWCTPCRDEAPVLAAVAKTVGPDVHFVGLDVRDSGNRAAGTAFQRKYALDYPSLDDADGALTLALRSVFVGNSAPPQTVVVGRDGRVVGRIAQRAEKSVLVSLVQEALSPAGSSPAATGSSAAS